MSSQKEPNITPSPSPLEMNLADVLFFAVRKHLIVFKDLTTSRYVHYTMVMNGSLIDVHKTLEDKGKHIPLAKIEFDWQFLMGRIIQGIRANWKSVFQVVNIKNPTYKDLEIEFIPVEVLMTLLSPVVKGARWNVDVKFLESLESSYSNARLGELAEHGLIIGTSSKGKAEYLILGYGDQCLLLDFSKMSEIIDKSFALSIRKIHLEHYTLSSILWYIKIRLQNLFHYAHQLLYLWFRSYLYWLFS